MKMEEQNTPIMTESTQQPKPRLRIIIDVESGAKVHPDGLPGYFGEMVDRAGEDWQTLRQIVPDFPAISDSPKELAHMVMEFNPNLEAKVSKKEMDAIEIRRKDLQ